MGEDHNVLLFSTRTSDADGGLHSLERPEPNLFSPRRSHVLNVGLDATAVVVHFCVSVYASSHAHFIKKYPREDRHRE